ncbi:MAG: hypothetical protein ABI175_27155 [Polyangiales bacterium]
MPKLASAICLALITLTALDASAEVRDHRTDPSPAAGQPAVTYRRRPGPRFMLPLKIDIGANGVNTDSGFARGVQAAVGIHWASLSPNPTRLDVGIGVFGSLMATPTDAMGTSHAIAYGGAYLEAGYALAAGTWWRTFATARGEYIGSAAFDSSHAGIGGTGRLSIELYKSGVGIEPRGLFLGSYALGLYVEAGGRDMTDGIGVFHGGMGITIRTPMVFSP